MSKVLITGALGNVGRYVVQNSAQSSTQSIAISAHSTVKVADVGIESMASETLTKLFGGPVEAVDFDFTDVGTFSRALEGIDRVFLMRPPHLGKPEDLKPFIDAMAETGKVKMICFLSLIGIEKNPFPPHYRIERMIEASGINYCHIRPSFFMQNLSGIHAHEIKHFDRILVPVGRALTSFIDAEDVGELVARVLLQPQDYQNTALEITGPEALDYWAVAEELTQVLGRSIEYAAPKPSLCKRYWTEVRGIPKSQAHVMSMLYWMTRMGTAKTVTATFERVMGKKPTDFKEFATKHKEIWER